MTLALTYLTAVLNSLDESLGAGNNVTVFTKTVYEPGPKLLRPGAGNPQNTYQINRLL